MVRTCRSVFRAVWRSIDHNQRITAWYLPGPVIAKQALPSARPRVTCREHHPSSYKLSHPLPPSPRVLETFRDVVTGFKEPHSRSRVASRRELPCDHPMKAGHGAWQHLYLSGLAL